MGNMGMADQEMAEKNLRMDRAHTGHYAPEPGGYESPEPQRSYLLEIGGLLNTIDEVLNVLNDNLRPVRVETDTLRETPLEHPRNELHAIQNRLITINNRIHNIISEVQL